MYKNNNNNKISALNILLLTPLITVEKKAMFTNMKS